MFIQYNIDSTFLWLTFLCVTGLRFIQRRSRKILCRKRKKEKKNGVITSFK